VTLGTTIKERRGVSKYLSFPSLSLFLALFFSPVALPFSFLSSLSLLSFLLYFFFSYHLASEHFGRQRDLHKRTLLFSYSFISYRYSNTSSSSFLFMMHFHFFSFANSSEATVPLSMSPPPLSPSFFLSFFFVCTTVKPLHCRHPCGSLVSSGPAPVVLEAARHPLWQFPPWLWHFLRKATRVFQSCCIITSWPRSPWLGSNPSPKSKLLFAPLFNTHTFFIFGLARFCEIWNKIILMVAPLPLYMHPCHLGWWLGPRLVNDSLFYFFIVYVIYFILQCDFLFIIVLLVSLINIVL